jgi:FkbM family methyltransferase
LEPDPRLFPVLQDNITRNGLGQVTACPVAAADQTGTLALAGYDEREGNWGISRITEKTEGDHCFLVSARRLDDLLDEHRIDDIDLLKMDIEGAEGFALAGLIDSLRQRRVKRLLLELHPEQLSEHGQSAHGVIDQLNSLGYRAWVVDHSRETYRLAAYGKQLSPRTFLEPLDANEGLDAWPHMLWVMPGLEPLA